MRSALHQLLESCTVRIDVNDEPSGTGFFVAPGMILTCAHVIRPNPEEKFPIKVIYKNKVYAPVKILREDIFPKDYPDLAILKVKVDKHPCVYLDGDYAEDHEFYSYGYAAVQPEGEGVFSSYDGPYGKHELIKLKFAGIQEGFSGSPLLNIYTQNVCGMIQMSRDPYTDLGGFAFPINRIESFFPKIIDANKKFHTTDTHWKNAVVGRKLLQNDTSTAVLSTKVNDLIYLPNNLIGRSADIKRVSEYLAKKYRLVLSGMGGIGKTAVAASLASSFVKKGKRVVWLQAGRSSAESMVDAIATCCKKADLLGGQTNDKQYIVLREILTASKIKLLVLDDMWNPSEVEKLLLGVPNQLLVLITSQLRISIGGSIELSEISRKDSIKLLKVYSGSERDFSKDPDASALCAQLGYSPFALELAGKHIQGDVTPKVFREKLSIGVVDLSPFSVERFKRRLIQEGYSKLDALTKKAFRAFGAFSPHGVTSQLLAAYLHQPLNVVESSLYKLYSRSLIKRRHDTSSHYLHSLLYDYIVHLPENKLSKRATVKSVINYFREHSQNFALIALDLPSILLALGSAASDELIKGICYLVLGGFPLRGPDSYFDVRGHTREMLILLNNAIEVATHKRKTYGKLLSSLHLQYAVAMFDRGEYGTALQFFERAVNNTKDKSRKIVLESAVARTLAFLGRYEEAKPVFDRLYDLAVKLKDPSVISMVLDQRAWAAGHCKDFESARTAALAQVEMEKQRYKLAPESDLYEDLFYSYLKLGSATLDLAIRDGGSVVGALDIHLIAWELVKDKDNPRLKGLALKALGEDYGYLKKKQKSISAFREGYRLLGSVGMIEKQNELMNIAKSFGYSPHIKIQLTKEGV